MHLDCPVTSVPNVRHLSHHNSQGREVSVEGGVELLVHDNGPG